MLRQAGLIFIVVLLFGGPLVFLQRAIDLQKDRFKPIDSRSPVFSKEALTVGALEFKSVIADWYWLRSVQLLGEEYLSEQDYNYIYQFIDRATDLNTKFSYMYEVGGIFFSLRANRIDFSNAILLKGIKNDPDSWQPWFYLGFNYFYHLKDSQKGAYYLAEASKRRRPLPAYLPLLSARLYAQEGQLETAVLFLKVVYLNVQDEIVKKNIAEKIEEIEKELFNRK